MLLDIAITGQTLVLAIAAIFALIIGVILVMRSVISSRAKSDLTQAHEGKSSKSPLENRNKYNEVDTFKWSGTFLNLGLALAVGLTVLAFSWTTYDEKVVIPEDALEIPEDIEIEPPRTAEPPPPPPPPPPPVIEEVPEEEIEEEDEPEFVDQTVEEETVVEAPEPIKEAPPPPPATTTTTTQT